MITYTEQWELLGSRPPLAPKTRRGLVNYIQFSPSRKEKEKVFGEMKSFKN